MDRPKVFPPDTGDELIQTESKQTFLHFYVVNQQLISPPIIRKPQQPQWVQQQLIKKRKLLAQPKLDEPILPATTTNRKVRSRIPFQWRIPTPPSIQASLPIQEQNPDQPTPPRKLPHKKSFLLRNLVRSHSISSSSSTTNHSLRNSSILPTSIIPSPSTSQPTRTSTQPAVSCNSSRSISSATTISSCSSSAHLSSINHQTDSEFDSNSDDHEEVLSSHSHSRPSPPETYNPQTRPFTPLSSCSSTHSLLSVSQLTLSDASGRSTGKCPTQCPLPLSPSDSTSPHPSIRELPFARPSPSMPRHHRLGKQQPRPTPAQAPPLPHSRTPSLLIRPKFASGKHNLDSSTHRIFNGPGNSNLRHQNGASDQDHGPTSRPKSDMMRALGWGRAPIDSPRLISHSHSLSDNFSSSDLSINCPLQDAIIADYLIASNSSNEQAQEETSPQVTPLQNRTKKFKDRFTLAGGTVPFKLSKKQHARHQSTTSVTGRRITSSFLGALSPTRNHHAVMDPGHERRKVEFKRMISYPVLNHSTSCDDVASHAEEKNYQSEPEFNCYNVSIEAAMRSLEGIKPRRATPISTPRPSSTAPTNDRPTSWILEDKPDLSDSDAGLEYCNLTGENSDAWKQKLRRRVSVNLLMMKSRNRLASSPSSPLGRSRNHADSGSPQHRTTRKQLRKKASARLRPLMRKISSASLRQRHWTDERGSGMVMETYEPGTTPGEENNEEELLALGRTPVKRRLNGELPGKLDFDRRNGQIHSSVPRCHITPRSASSPSVSLGNSQKVKPLLRSSQSIREKRKIFEQRLNPPSDSILHPPVSAVLSSSAGSVASSGHSISIGAMPTSSAVDRSSSVLSERRHSQRKPTPAEIKLRDETQSVKALVDKFETQHHHNSSRRSIGLNSQKGNNPGDGSQAGRTGSTGVVRTSLLSLWSGDRSSVGSRRTASRRLSRQVIIEQRKKKNWRNSHITKDGEGATQLEGRQVRKLRKKAKKIFCDNNSSSSSFGCTLNEEDEYTYGLEDPHIDLSLPIKLPGPSDNQHLSMVLPKSSIQQKRSTWSVGHISPWLPAEDKQQPPVDQNIQSCKSRITCSDLSRSTNDSVPGDPQDGVGSEPPALSEKPSFDSSESNQHGTGSVLSSEQAHKAQTILEPQTIWMGDGSQRQIFVAGGCLQVAKKIPFPSFEDDAEFNQNVNLPTSTEPLTSNLVSKPAEPPTPPINRLNTFLMTRKFDDALLDGNEGEEACPRGRFITETSLDRKQDSVMLSPVGIVSLEDSPTLGRCRRSWNQSMLPSCSKSSSPSSLNSSPDLLLVPDCDVGEKDEAHSNSSGTGTPNSLEIQRLYLGTQRCEGVGNKMFGSTIRMTQHNRASPVGRRTASAIIFSGTARLVPLSPTGSCPSPSISHPPTQSSRSPTCANVLPCSSQSSSPPCMTSARSSLLKCERIVHSNEGDDDNTEMTDLMDCGEETIQTHQLKLERRRVPSAAIIPNSNILNLCRQAGHLEDDFDMGDLDESADKTLRYEIARLERVRAKWLKLCSEVEDVLRKSRERWPDPDPSVRVLKEFVDPITKSSIHSFLQKSRNLYRETTPGEQPFTSRQVGLAADLTPPPRHPFGRQSVISASAGNLGQMTRGQGGTDSREASITPYKSRDANETRQAQGGLPLIITLPVPSAFVSPERFRIGPKAPKSETGPRIKKISHTSWRSSPRHPALSNHRLGSPSAKSVTTRDQRRRLISATSSTNVSITSSNGKVILGERSVNQFAMTTTGQTSGDQKPVSFPPKRVGDNSTANSSRTIGSLGRTTTGRASMAKWDLENEGASLLMSATVRKTRKPWRRSILNREILPREPRVSLAGSVSSSAEEVGVLVAAGEQPRELSSALHVSSSLRLKHRRRLNHIRHQ
ncbi:hypothetical protein VP01_183g4 [Puccinia sorghi]|uniref:Uncharacterized protein n=1 Tax=Puccinia sorghi TaxID=27349 RepID=A0A0L6VDS8_9BASI|nr:hypothetical protein VP01_183g4 [Puccinia sorghi]